MPTIIEREWTTEAGLSAQCRSRKQHYRCGYVAVDQTHPLYGINIEDIRARNLDVHGGITLSARLDDSTNWWFGFDCLHRDDCAIETEEMEFPGTGEIRTLEFVVSECEKLAKQLAAMGANDGNE